MGVSQLNKMDRSRIFRSKGGVYARKSLEAMAARKSGAWVIESNKNISYKERNIDDYLPVTIIERMASTPTNPR